MKKAILILLVILALSITQRAFAVCTPGSNWTAVWTDSFLQTTYSIEAPCKVYIGIPFTITATVTDSVYPNNNVGFGWTIKDNSAVIAGGGFNWITTAGGQWQKVLTQTYTGTPIDHVLEFQFSDMGQGSGAHLWAANLIGDLTVDPFPPTANTPPQAEAGSDLLMASSDQNSTSLHGTASDADGDTLTYRWLEGAVELQASRQVDAAGNAPCDLAAAPRLSTGSHTFTLEVSDGSATVTDNVVVSVENSRPLAAPSVSGTFPVNEDISLTGTVADYDGDVLAYRWLEGSTVLAQGSVIAPAGGTPVQLPAQVLFSGLHVGSHTITLELNDGINTVVAETIVTVIDTVAPTLAPSSSTTILWPPNGKMTHVTINANTHDNSGGQVKLTVMVTSSQPPRMDKRGRGTSDYSVLTIDQTTGVIVLALRNAQEKELTYTVAITATDASGNSSVATVSIKAGALAKRH